MIGRRKLITLVSEAAAWPDGARTAAGHAGSRIHR
jgi:hypothetical protein